LTLAKLYRVIYVAAAAAQLYVRLLSLSGDVLLLLGLIAGSSSLSA